MKQKLLTVLLAFVTTFTPLFGLFPQPAQAASVKLDIVDQEANGSKARWINRAKIQVNFAPDKKMIVYDRNIGDNDPDYKDAKIITKDGDYSGNDYDCFFHFFDVKANKDV